MIRACVCVYVYVRLFAARLQRCGDGHLRLVHSITLAKRSAQRPHASTHTDAMCMYRLQVVALLVYFSIVTSAVQISHMHECKCYPGIACYSFVET